jgi:hypothetical protein
MPVLQLSAFSVCFVHVSTKTFQIRDQTLFPYGSFLNMTDAADGFSFTLSFFYFILYNQAFARVVSEAFLWQISCLFPSGKFPTVSCLLRTISCYYSNQIRHRNAAKRILKVGRIWQCRYEAPDPKGVAQ